MIKIIEGNIVNAKTDFIIHQVNCQGEMNTGVAKALRDYDEGIYKHYRKFCEFCKFEPEELLGTCDAYLLKDRGQIVLSLFAQNKYGYDGKQYTDLEAFRDGLRYISQHFGVWREKNGLEGKDLCRTSVALPYKIGCGRGGADWEVIYKIIEDELMVMYETFINLLRNIKRNTIVHIINIMDGIFIGLQQCRISVKVLHQKRL